MEFSLLLSVQLLDSVSGICIFKGLDCPCLCLLLCSTTLLLQIRLAGQSMYAEKIYEALRMKKKESSKCSINVNYCEQHCHRHMLKHFYIQMNG